MLIIGYTPPLGLPKLVLRIKHAYLVGLNWQNSPATICSCDALDDDRQVAKATAWQLDEYFAGKRERFDLPLDWSHGTDFQIKVWQALMGIPYGQTISYATLAKNINQPTAYRACANANGKNPISLIIPCHRVIASDGGIGGYTGGIFIKRILLELENATFKK